MAFSKIIKNKKSIEEVKIDRFRRLSKDASKKKKRLYEMQLLTPDKIPEYIGKKTTSKIAKKVLKIVFNDEAEISLLRNYMKINYYISYNTRDIEILLSFFHGLEKGKLVYNKNKDKLFFVRKGKKYRI